MAKRYDYFTVRVLKDTTKALLVELGGRQVWVPRSVVEDASDVKWAGDEGTLVVGHWWAVKEDLVDE